MDLVGRISNSLVICNGISHVLFIVHGVSAFNCAGGQLGVIISDLG